MSAERKKNGVAASEKAPAQESDCQPVAPAGPVLAFPVVGIGASAGGMAALEAFFSGMPRKEQPGFSFVVVQHHAPDRKSLLPELLARLTDLPVREIADGMRVEANAVHVAPAGVDIALLPAGTFGLTALPALRAHVSMIDNFFTSLARSLGERAGAIVLSGSGCDGAAGVEVVKSQGGLVIVQEPASAEFDGMPLSAIGTGLVDLVAPPAEMYARLKSYFTHVGNAPATGTIEVNEEALREIFELLSSQVGHDFSHYKTGTVGRRLMRRLAVHQLTSVASYLELLRTSREEAMALFRELLIGVTGFFRDPEVFAAVESRVLPELCLARGGGVRVWVAGCATGEEAYSLAILMAEWQAKHSDRKSLFGRFGHPPEPASLNARHHGVDTARTGEGRQDRE